MRFLQGLSRWYVIIALFALIRARQILSLSQRMEASIRVLGIDSNDMLPKIQGKKKRIDDSAVRVKGRPSFRPGFFLYLARPDRTKTDGIPKIGTTFMNLVPW